MRLCAHAPLLCIVLLLLLGVTLAATDSSDTRGTVDKDEDNNTDDSSSIGNPQNGCPADGPKPITCEDGQDSVYVSQTSVQCAHYMCPPAKDKSDDNEDGDSDSKTRSVIIPAVLGTVIPLVVIATGIFFYFHRRNRNRESMDRHYHDSKYLSGYSNLDENAFGGYMRSPNDLSSGYSISKWRDSAAQDAHTSGSQASIPIIFSAEYSARPSADNSRETKLFNEDEAAQYRETRLFSGTASAEDVRKWAAPSVVNLNQMPQTPQTPQMPQMVILNHPNGESRPTTATSHLEIDTAGARDPLAAGANRTSSDSGINADPSANLQTPGSGDSPVVTEITTTAATEMPRIVQVGKTQATRAVEPENNQEQAVPGSPLRVSNNGWDSDSDYDSDNSSGKDSDVLNSKQTMDRGLLDNPQIHSKQPLKDLESSSQLQFETTPDDSFSKDVLAATNIFSEDGQPRKP
ncbi:hypothetical protein COEREDRAFT_13994 [Coemansia reversa NRRL 1564]|uniref:Uncharacterized protein n=1 Tax=Coemansia reversa (strain ATCC 12441 / NRRL 1564) TaxID=763665 RepID=A0A2G5BHF5_COERN|nr:hypothetical protein COEREDRAFT_13994 [Coemansia reversa NRRL 1564]|eukprot:PIA18456.1 hypothetical protein COEREDRAFT_13994 [Coemansia reversa NRRL 1564]